MNRWDENLEESDDRLDKLVFETDNVAAEKSDGNLSFFMPCFSLLHFVFISLLFLFFLHMCENFNLTRSLWNQNRRSSLLARIFCMFYFILKLASSLFELKKEKKGGGERNKIILL